MQNRPMFTQFSEAVLESMKRNDKVVTYDDLIEDETKAIATLLKEKQL